MNVLFTGGSGLLGRAVRKLRPEWHYPSRGLLNVSFPIIYASGVDVIVHAAAITSPPRVDQSPAIASRVNIAGTVNMVELARDMEARLIYLSTDYVFRGDRGQYAEEDELHPANKYAWSKLGGECAVRMYDRGLIVRGSFGAVPFPYERAFVDQWTTRLPVGEFARRLIEIVEADPPLTGVVHICGPRQTVYEYAGGIPNNGDIEPIHRSDVPFEIPWDTSLVSTRKDL